MRGDTIQFWLFSRDNPHDRGILRTGRHEGDWELVEVRPGRDVIASQHSGGERCGWDEIERVGTHPVIYAANGSHANYFAAGTRDRTWPDPNDEADGRGRSRARATPARPVASAAVEAVRERVVVSRRRGTGQSEGVGAARRGGAGYRQYDVRPLAPARVKPKWMWLRCACVGSTCRMRRPLRSKHGAYLPNCVCRRTGSRSPR